jgi:hypothetical protein
MHMAEAAEAVDPLRELTRVRGYLDTMLSGVAQDKVYDFSNQADIILEQYANGEILPDGLPWPWPTLTSTTKGMQKGDLIILSGRPKTRKTFIALQVAMHAFSERGARVLVFSPEMAPPLLLLRAMAMAAHVDYAALKMADLSLFEEMSLLETVEKFGQFDNNQFIRVENGENSAMGEDPLDVDEREAARGYLRVIKSTGMSLSEMGTYIDEHKPELCIFDSVYRQSPEGETKSDSDQKKQTTISRGLKDMAADKGLIFLATHQINREGDKKLGSLANLAYSDAFSQDADLVLRAITCKIPDANDETALITLGGRETPIDGVMINNVPCSNFTELRPIESVKKELDRFEAIEKQSSPDEEGEGEGEEENPWKKTKARKDKVKKRAKDQIKSMRMSAIAAEKPPVVK